MSLHKAWFNEKAAIWDSVVLEEEKCRRLYELIKELKIKTGSRVLDVGTGTGVLLPWVLEAAGATGRITAIDFAEEMINRAKSKNYGPGVEFFIADVHDLSFFDEQYDEVICNSAFPHFHNQSLAMREMSRVLKRGGRLTVCHPAPRKELNAFHRNLGGVVENDLLPPEEVVRELARLAGLTEVMLKDGPKTYLFTGLKYNKHLIGVGRCPKD